MLSLLICCCEGKAAGRALGAWMQRAGASQSHMHDCCSGAGSKETPSRAPHDRGPCDCRVKDTAKDLPNARPMLEQSGAAPVAVVERSMPVASSSVEVGVRAVEPRAIGQPPTSLLRLHCALII